VTCDVTYMIGRRRNSLQKLNAPDGRENRHFLFRALFFVCASPFIALCTARKRNAMFIMSVHPRLSVHRTRTTLCQNEKTSSHVFHRPNSGKATGNI